MNKILNLALVGVPNTGKTRLINEVKRSLRGKYNIFTIPNAMAYLADSGLNESINITNKDFQLECLSAYKTFYTDLFLHQKNYTDASKPTIIFHENTPYIGKAFLGNKDSRSKVAWEDSYRKAAVDFYNKLAIDKVYIIEMGQGTYQSCSNFDVNRAISVESKIIKDCMEFYSDAEVLLNQFNITEKTNIILDYIDFYFNSTSPTATLHQKCYNCNWEGFIDLNHPYRFCPMCGFTLGYCFRKDNSDDTPKDPLGEEARRKMFYVDYDKLPKYNSTVTLFNPDNISYTGK